MSLIVARIAEAMAAGAEDIAARSGVRGLTKEDVRVGKTPEGIERIWLSRMMSRKTNKAIFEQEEQMAERQHQSNPFPLLPYSQLVYAMEQKHPGVYDFSLAFAYDAEKIDTERLDDAIQIAIANHPAFRGNEQYYHLEAHKQGATSVGRVSGECRAALGPTGLLLIRLNRILGDGYSFGLLLEDISKAYQGIALEPDYYFRYLQQVENRKQTAEYAEHEQELRERYGAVDGKTIPVRPTLDKEIEDDDEWLAGEYILPISEEDVPAWFLAPNRGKGAEGGKGASMNTLVCQATVLAIMDYCGTDEAALTWAYLGRENEQERHIFGSLHRDIPLRLRRGEDVKEEMQRGVRLSDYPWTLTDPQHEVWQYAVNVLQQPRLEDLDLHGLEFWPSEMKGNGFDEALMKRRWSVDGGLVEDQQTAYSLLDIEIEEMQLRFKYSATHYKKESIIRFAEMIKRYL